MASKRDDGEKITYRTNLNTVVLTYDESGIDGCYIGTDEYDYDDPDMNGPEFEIVSWVRDEWNDAFAVGAMVNAVATALTVGLTKEELNG